MVEFYQHNLDSLSWPRHYEQHHQDVSYCFNGCNELVFLVNGEVTGYLKVYPNLYLVKKTEGVTEFGFTSFIDALLFVDYYWNVEDIANVVYCIKNDLYFCNSDELDLFRNEEDKMMNIPIRVRLNAYGGIRYLIHQLIEAHNSIAEDVEKVETTFDEFMALLDF